MAILGEHVFGLTCRRHGIERRLTKVNHPWTNGQVERMNRTIKEAAVYRYKDRRHLQEHLDTFLCACNFAKRLKTLNGLTPYQFIVKPWGDDPGVFVYDTSHLNLGLYTYIIEGINADLRR